MSGWLFTFDGGAVSWASKKQTCISQPMPAISLYCDSEATMSKAHSKVYNGKSRHISLRHKYVKQLIVDKIITTVLVRSSKNLVDLFTKGLSRDFVKSTSSGMSLNLLCKSHM